MAFTAERLRTIFCSPLFSHTHYCYSRCVCVVITYSKGKDQPGNVANPARGQLNRKIIFLLCPRLRLLIWSRETGLAVPSRDSLLISILRLKLVLTSGIPPEFRGGVYLFIPTPYAIGPVPSLAGHAIAYRWRPLPRVRRHRASKPQSCSKRVLPWQVTIYQLMCTFLSYTHCCWYEVGMLKVPAWTRAIQKVSKAI